MSVIVTLSPALKWLIITLDVIWFVIFIVSVGMYVDNEMSLESFRIMCAATGVVVVNLIAHARSFKPPPLGGAFRLPSTISENYGTPQG